jgi:hypothetical protein
MIILFQSMMFQSPFSFLPAGHRFTLQCPQSRPTLATRTSCAETGSLFGVWRCDVNFATLFLHAGCSLVGLYLVLHWKNRCRQWGENLISRFFLPWKTKINLNETI